MFLDIQNEFQTTDFKKWAEVIKDTFGGLDISTASDASFKASLSICSFGQFNLIMVESSPVHVWHTGSIGNFSEEERFLVKVQFSGTSLIKFGENTVSLKPGDYLICDNSRSYALEFDEETEILSIPIPKKVLERFHAKPAGLAFLKADKSLAINNILFDYLRSLWESRDMKSIDLHRKRLIANFFDLLVLGFSDMQGASLNISSTQHGHLERCKAYIDNNLVEEDLSPTIIAKELAISQRYLFSIFASAGLTVSGYIISQRLDKAAQMLRSQRFELQTVSQIAFDTGFKSAAHFSRAFKERFRESPTQYRKRSFN